jgi:exodeoxyribonuclease VII small subunit
MRWSNGRATATSYEPQPTSSEEQIYGCDWPRVRSPPQPVTPSRVGAMAVPDERPIDVPGDPQALTYEQARDELIEVVRRLEAGNTTLEEALSLWERGEALAKVCQDWLDGARARIEAAKAAVDSRRAAS